MISKTREKRKRLKKQKARMYFYCFAEIMLFAAIITGIIIYNKGNDAQTNAEQLLTEYEKGVAEQMTYQATAESTDYISATATALPVTPTPDFSQWIHEGHEVIGKLTIEKIGQELPVISDTDTETLEVSCCYYKGSMPGEKGNMVITGHNYANGSIFGKLDELVVGDTIKLSTPQSEEYIYKVYNTEVITPDDVGALDEYEGDMVLTLMTCTSNGNRRLLIRCQITEQA